MGEAYQGVGEYVEEGYVVGAFFWLIFGGGTGVLFSINWVGLSHRYGICTIQRCVSTILVHFLFPIFVLFFTTLTIFFSLYKLGGLGGFISIHKTDLVRFLSYYIFIIPTL